MEDGDANNLVKQAWIFKMVQRHNQNILGDCWLGTRHIQASVTPEHIRM
jgi:hypothetical protein